MLNSCENSCDHAVAHSVMVQIERLMLISYPKPLIMSLAKKKLINTINKKQKTDVVQLYITGTIFHKG